MAAVLPQSINLRSSDIMNDDIRARRLRAVARSQMPKMPTPAGLVDSNKKYTLQISDFDEVDKYIKLVRSSTLENTTKQVLEQPATLFDEPLKGAVEKALASYQSISKSCENLVSGYANVVPEIYVEISDMSLYMASGMGQFFADLKTLNSSDSSETTQASCRSCIDLFLNESQSRFAQAQRSITTLQKGLAAFEQDVRPAQDRLIDAQTVISQRYDYMKKMTEENSLDGVIYYVLVVLLRAYLDPTTQALTDINTEWTIALLHVEILEGAYGAVLDDLSNVIAAVREDSKDTIDVILDIDQEQLIAQWDNLKKEVDKIRGTDTPGRVFGYAKKP